MDEPSLYFRLFSRRAFDSRDAGKQLQFVTGFANGIFLPDECGPYDPFEPFDEDAFATYVSWLIQPGGEFGFRRSRPPFPVEGYLANRLFPEILIKDAASREPELFSTMPAPSFRVRWSMRIGWATSRERDTFLIERFLVEACQTADADYGFVAFNSDYERKHFSSVRYGHTKIQQDLGDDPDRGIPGLYWMNFFGSLYVDWFGKEKLAAVSKYAETIELADGALFIRIDDGPKWVGGLSIPERQRRAIQVLGEGAFFDIRRPGRILDIPPKLVHG